MLLAIVSMLICCDCIPVAAVYKVLSIPTPYYDSRFSSCVDFFFSSRRRHTRSYGDWSSDVCSSDLDRIERSAAATQHVHPPHPGAFRRVLHGGVGTRAAMRQEERAHGPRTGERCFNLSDRKSVV